jgi:hypothetical protein
MRPRLARRSSGFVHTAFESDYERTRQGAVPVSQTARSRQITLNFVQMARDPCDRASLSASLRS